MLILRKKICLILYPPFENSTIHIAIVFTPPRTQNKWTKISGLETNIFGSKMTVNSDLEFFILKFN